MGKKGEKNTSTEIKTTKAQAIKDSKKDIDDLFSSFEKEKKKEITQQKKEKKEKSKAVPKNSNKEGKPASTPKSKKKRKIEDRDNDEDDDFFDNRGESKKRKIVDGVKVYSLEELQVGKGGDTPLCPFDCDCCF